MASQHECSVLSWYSNAKGAASHCKMICNACSTTFVIIKFSFSTELSNITALNLLIFLVNFNVCWLAEVGSHCTVVPHYCTCMWKLCTYVDEVAF